MTTIACNRLYMASDSYADMGVKVAVPKVFVLADRLIGLCGYVPAAMKFAQWMRSGADPRRMPEFDEDKDHEWDAIELTHDGIFTWDQNMGRTPIDTPYYAIGSGQQAAFYVLHHNGTPEDAVNGASEVDAETHLPVRVFRLPGRKVRKAR